MLQLLFAVFVFTLEVAFLFQRVLNSNHFVKQFYQFPFVSFYFKVKFFWPLQFIYLWPFVRLLLCFSVIRLTIVLILILFALIIIFFLFVLLKVLISPHFHLLVFGLAQLSTFEVILIIFSVLQIFDSFKPLFVVGLALSFLKIQQLVFLLLRLAVLLIQALFRIVVSQLLTYHSFQPQFFLFHLLLIEPIVFLTVFITQFFFPNHFFHFRKWRLHFDILVL